MSTLSPAVPRSSVTPRVLAPAAPVALPDALLRAYRTLPVRQEPPALKGFVTVYSSKAGGKEFGIWVEPRTGAAAFREGPANSPTWRAGFFRPKDGSRRGLGAPTWLPTDPKHLAHAAAIFEAKMAGAVSTDVPKDSLPQWLKPNEAADAKANGMTVPQYRRHLEQTRGMPGGYSSSVSRLIVNGAPYYVVRSGQAFPGGMTSRYFTADGTHVLST